MHRIVPLLSIALLITCAIGWPRSRSRDEGFAVIIWEFAIGAGWSNGSPSLALGTIDFDSDKLVNVYGWSSSDTRGDLRELLYDHAAHSFARFGFMAGAGDRYAIITLPWWSIVTAATIAPVMWMRRILRRRHRTSRGLCLHCGYDLRATTNRCPECGTPTPPVSRRV